MRSIREENQQPANVGILSYLEGRSQKRPDIPTDFLPKQLPESELHIRWDLGTHPDLVERLWRQLTVKLPQECQWLIYGNPVLVHPESGIVFAFAGGTHTYALRLPERERREALAAGATRVWKYPAYPNLNIQPSELHLDRIGPEWVFGHWLKGEEDWCLAAYQLAGEGGPEAA